MTRINVIPPRELVDKHLLAEYRELPRVFGLIEKWQDRGCPETGVTRYTMGKGHVKFFYNKAVWLAMRFDQLVAEMQHRDFKPPVHQSVAQSQGYWLDWPAGQYLGSDPQRPGDQPRSNQRKTGQNSLRRLKASLATKSFLPDGTPTQTVDFAV